MKTKLSIITAICMAALLSLGSCKQAPSTKVVLATEIDSLSYSFGTTIAQQLTGTLRQTGLVTDTMGLFMEYTTKIGMEKDEATQAKLKKEMRHKIDSTHRANQYAISELLIGFEEGMNSRASKTSYNFGHGVGTQVSQFSLEGMVNDLYGANSGKEMNKAAIVAALSATMQQKQLMFPDASYYMQMKGQELQERKMGEERIKQAAIREENAKYLEQNKQKEGVVALESGVQYRIIKEGTGEKPTAESVVQCHYEGKLISGEVFDSSVQRGEPVDFPVGEVIAGWTEVLQLMPVGSKWEVTIPFDKAYGEQGNPSIPPFSTLIFEIELLSINK